MEPMRSRKKGEGLNGRFLALPHSVLRTREFLGLSNAAVRLLVIIGLGYNGRNNGRLVACRRSLEPMGWRSADSTVRCLKQLISSGLLVQTRMGKRPNVTAWFALPWRELDQRAGIDFDPRSYPRFIGTPVVPLAGQRQRCIAPKAGKILLPIAPVTGTMDRERADAQ